MKTDLTLGSIDGSPNAPVAPAANLPRLADLTEGQRKQVFADAVRVRLRKEMDAQITALSESVNVLIDEFLRTRRSHQTRIRYRNGIRRWIAYCSSSGVHPLLATPKDADLFAAQLTGAPASVNSAISGVSSFYATLYKWGKIQRTPFIRIARRQESACEKHIPTAKEVNQIIIRADGHDFLRGSIYKEAIMAMAYRGFRVGALPHLMVNGRRFTTTSKGKAWQGELPPRVVRALLPMGKQPFAAVKTGTIQTAFKRLTRRLTAAGVIAHAYSVHDLRHFYATSEYRRDRDLVRVSRLLNHADVKVTTKYLHDLGAMEERHGR